MSYITYSEKYKEDVEKMEQSFQQDIDNYPCYYCKHARLELAIDYTYGNSYYEPWCTIDGRNDWCGLIDQKQMCMFWEYYKSENR